MMEHRYHSVFFGRKKNYISIFIHSRPVVEIRAVRSLAVTETNAVEVMGTLLVANACTLEGQAEDVLDVQHHVCPHRDCARHLEGSGFRVQG